MNKSEARKLCVKVRKNVQFRKEKNKLINENLHSYLMQKIDRLNIIACYYAINYEVKICKSIFNFSCLIALPLVDQKNNKLLFKHWNGDAAKLQSGPFSGLLEPEMKAKSLCPDIMIVPMLAYDLRKYRLGYGGGFYDRAIDYYNNCISIGLAYSDQEIDSIPLEPHDKKLDLIITDNKIIY